MELRNRFIINSLIGFVIGTFVGVGFWMLTPGDDSGRSLPVHLIMSAIHGMIPVGAATIYDIESWGLTKCTIVHALITFATIVAIEIPMKWWPSQGQFAVAIVIYIAIYAIIWLFNYLYWKRTVRDINARLGLIRDHDGQKG